jgi:hypothetical protein
MALPILDGNQSATTLSTILTGGQHIPAHTVVSLGSQAITDIVNATSAGLTNTQLRASAVTVGGTVTVGNSLTISSLPAISGTVTANVFGLDAVNQENKAVPVCDPVDLSAQGVIIPVGIQIGTVTANNTNLNRLVQDGETQNTFGVPIVYARIAGGELDYWKEVSQNSGLPVANQVNVGGDIVPFAISGTVTVGAMPSGALTTRFGSVTTANTAQLTSAVTNTSRKFLLVQNIATSTVTIGIGFTPTTTQGIQLTAGAGLTFDAFCPTGGVWWLSSTTGSNFSILEG